MSSVTEHSEKTLPTSSKGRAEVHRTLRNWIDDSTIRPQIREDLTEYIHVQRIGGLLYHIEGHLSEANTQLCRTIWQQNTSRYLSQIAVLSQFPEGTVQDCLAIKGLDYAENLYRDPGSRQCADLDLIAHPNSRAEIQSMFGADSLRASSASSVGIEQSGCLVEIHTTFAPIHLSKLHWASLISSGSMRTIDGLTYRFPCPVDRLNIWLINQAKASFVDGLWAYVDLALILKDLRYGPNPMTWQQLGEQAKSVDLDLAFQLALARLHHFNIWPLEPLPARTRRSELVRRFLTGADTPHPLPSVWKRQGLQFALTRRGFHRRFAQMALEKLTN